MKMLYASVALYTALSAAAFAAECTLKPAFEQIDDEGERMAPVWDSGKGTPLFFGSNLAINTDGNKRSYSVLDFWGHKDALNNLCNAMADKCDSNSDGNLTDDEMIARRKLTENARAKKWPPNLLAETKIEPKIIPLRDDGKPCDEVDGFLVSATALANPKIENLCDQNRYLDAVKVSAIVLPGQLKKKTPTGVVAEPTGFDLRNAKVGDLVAVFRRDGTKVAFGVVGDSGPKRNLGEGTIRLAGSLLGKADEPVNYDEIMGRPPFEGKGWAMKRVYTVIFPGTRNTSDPFITQDRIDKAASVLLEKWGGKKKFEACRDEYLAAEGQ